MMVANASAICCFLRNIPNTKTATITRWNHGGQGWCSIVVMGSETPPKEYCQLFKFEGALKADEIADAKKIMEREKFSVCVVDGLKNMTATMEKFYNLNPKDESAH